jgi:hypothetical protein
MEHDEDVYADAVSDGMGDRIGWVPRFASF